MYMTMTVSNKSKQNKNHQLRLFPDCCHVSPVLLHFSSILVAKTALSPSLSHSLLLSLSHYQCTSLPSFISLSLHRPFLSLPLSHTHSLNPFLPSKSSPHSMILCSHLISPYLIVFLFAPFCFLMINLTLPFHTPF
jgi:hypothetical protein